MLYKLRLIPFLQINELLARAIFFLQIRFSKDNYFPTEFISIKNNTSVKNM